MKANAATVEGRTALNVFIVRSVHRRFAKFAIDQDRAMWELCQEALVEYMDRREKRLPARAGVAHEA